MVLGKNEIKICLVGVKIEIPAYEESLRSLWER